MKFMALGLLVLCLSWVTPGHTDEHPNTQSLQNLPLFAECGTTQAITDIVVGRYREVPMATADVSWLVPNGTWLQGPMIIWTNPETRTVTITIGVGDEYMCMLLPGQAFGPFNRGTRL
jgi:hypothetical protein